MEEYGEELRDVKREIIESRSLVIKTNNLTNALAADLKTIGKRQQKFERRAFWNSSVANALFFVFVLVVVKFAWDARVSSVEQDTRRARTQVAQLSEELKEQRKLAERRAAAESAAASFYELMRADKKKELVTAYDGLRDEPLTRAERAVFRDAVDRAAAQLSFDAYHTGLEHTRSDRWHEAVLAFEESMRYGKNAAHAATVQLNLAKGYRRLNRQRDAIPLLQKLAEASADTEVLDDATFLLAECLIDIQAYNDAKSTLRSFIRRYPKSPFVNDAKMTLADLTLRH